MATDFSRWHREVPLPPRRLVNSRDRRDSGRSAFDAVNLVPGGVRASVRVLRDGGNGVHRNLQMFEIAGQVREMKLLDPPSR